MKKNLFLHDTCRKEFPLFGQLALCSAAILFASVQSRGAVYTKTDTTSLTGISDWNPAGTPDVTGTAVFDSSLSALNALNLSVATSSTIGTLVFNSNLNGPVVFSGVGTLCGGTNGVIDLSAANKDVTFNSAVNTMSLLTSGSGRTLTFSGGGTGFLGFDGLGRVLFSSATAKSYTIAVGSARTYLIANSGNTTAETGGMEIGANSTLTYGGGGGGFNIGRVGEGLVTVNSPTATLDLTSNSYISIGRGGGTGKLLMLSGTVKSTTVEVGYGETDATQGSGVLDIRGGYLTTSSGVVLGELRNAGVNNSPVGKFLMSGGTAVIPRLNFGGNLSNGYVAGSGSGTMGVTGGLIYIGSGGITNTGTGAFVYGISLATGTMAASADWGSSLNMKLAGNYNFQAADQSAVAKNITLSGALSNDGANTGALTKTGAGTLTLSGSNSYTGATTINAGVLNVGGSNALAGGGSLTFGGGSLQYSSGNQVDYSGRIVSSGGAIGIDTNGQNVTFASAIASSNSGGLTKSGSGTLTLSSSNGYTGATQIAGGILSLGNAKAMGTGTMTFTGNSTLQSALASGTIANAIVINPSVTGTFDSQSNTNTLSGAISGNGGFTKTGAGTLTLSGSNSYTGTTTISGGFIQVNGITNTLGNSTGGNVTLNGGGISAAWTSSQYPGWAITVGANGGTILGSGSAGKFGFSSGLLQGSGTLTLMGSNGFNRFSLNDANQYNFSGKWVIDGSGTGFFVDQFEGNDLGTGTGDNLVTLQNNGTVLMRGGTVGSATQGFTVGSGGASFNGAAGMTNTMAAKISSTGTDRVTFGPQASGVVIFSNTGNSYSGDTYFAPTTAGLAYLRLGAAEVIPNGSGKGNLVLVNNGGSAALDLNGFSETINGLSNYNGTTYSADSVVDNLAASTTATLTLGDNNATSTFTGVIKNSGSNSVLALTKTGTGTQTLSGANTFTGTTLISNGKIALGNALALQNSAWDTTGATGAIGLNVTGYATPTLGGLKGSVDLATGITGYSSVTGLTLNPQAGVTGTYSGVIANGAATMTLTKTGSGTQILSGSNTYTGMTTISSGTLQIGAGGTTGSLASSGTITNNGALVFNRSDAIAQGTNFSAAGISGTGSLTQAGSGTLTLSATNTYTGPTIINGGFIKVNGITNTLGNGTNGSVTLNGGGIIMNATGADMWPSWTLTVGANGGALQNTGTGAWGIGNGGSHTILNGSGTLVIQNTGYTSRAYIGATQTSFSGKWLIDGSLGSGGNNLDDNGQGSNLWGTYSGSDAITLTNGGGLWLFTGASGDSLGNASKGITVGSGGGILANNNCNVGIAAPIVGTGSLNLNARGGFALTISNTNNSYAGDTIISTQMSSNSARVVLGASNVIPDGTGKGNVVLTSGSAGNAITLDLNGMSETINGLSNATANAADAIVDNQAASTTATLTVGGNNATSSFGGVIKNSGSSATLAVTKIGLGTQTLSGTSSYAGATNVNAGKLILSGSLSGTTSVSVLAAAELRVTGGLTTAAALAISGTLSGNGQMGAVTLASGATTTPGSSGTNTGILTATSFNEGSGAHLSMEINGTTAGTGADQVVTTANSGLTLAGDLKLTIGAGYTPANSDVLLLVLNNGTGAVNGAFSGISITDNSGTNNYSGAQNTSVLLNGQAFTLSYTAGNGNDLALLAVPEPGTWAMFLGGFGMLLSIQRLRKNRVGAR